MNVGRVRQDFPILSKKVNGKPLVYFDNAATSQKPRRVISSIQNFYENHNANIHRGIHQLAEEATGLYEETRKKVARFINARSEREIIFVRNTTEALNLVAYAWGRLNINPGDEIITSVMEHHSNFLPWRQLAVENGAKLKVLDIDDSFKLKSIQEALTKKTKLVALAHASNVLGTINPISEIVSQTRNSANLALTVVDGAQFIPHGQVDVRQLGCDFYAFSGHKMFGPMGAGVLWGREEIISNLAPFLFGGGMITSVTLDTVSFAPAPEKFEAGTPSVADVIGLGSAVDYVQSIGYDSILKHERTITGKLIKDLSNIPEITLYGPDNTKDRVPAVSFTVKNIHPHDVAQFLSDEYAVAVRAGQHCAGPLHERLEMPATVRASLAFYNTEAEVDVFIKAVKDLIKTFRS